MKKVLPKEAEEQIKVFDWAKIHEKIYPELQFMYHVPNGGSRNKIEAIHLKRQGVRPGVPDICLPVAKGRYCGLYIEMKRGKNKPTDKQIEFIEFLSLAGYAVTVCRSADEAIEVIKLYMRGGVIKTCLNVSSKNNV